MIVLADADQLLFGPFTLDRKRRALRAGGRDLPLNAKTFDLLELLVLRRGEAVSKEDILAHVWRGRIVGENNVPVQMSALRRVLTDHGGGAPYIITLPDQRYRFVEDVEERRAPDPPVAAPPPAPALPTVAVAAVAVRHRVPKAAAAALLLGLALAGIALLWREAPRREAAQPELSMMVLPFRNLSDDKADVHLADAVTDDLTADLSRISGALVIARETADSYAARSMTASDIGRALHVRYLVQGNVEPLDGVLRINAQLIETATDGTLWARHFDVPRDRIGTVQDLIVARILAALDLQLVEAESSRSLRARPDNPKAIDLFFRARSILDRGESLKDYQAAQGLLEQAIRQEPDFGDALAELGWMLVCKIANIDDPDVGVDAARARAVTERAMSISPNNPRALSARGRLHALDGDYDGAIASAKTALAIDANNADAQLVLATAAFYQGHLDGAALPLEASLRTDPEGPTSRLRTMRLGNIRLLQGDLSKAIELLRAASQGEPDPPAGTGRWGLQEKTRLMLIAALQLNGSADAAHTLFQHYRISWPHRSVWRVGTLAPKTLSDLPGFKDFLDALHQAGMPVYASEDVDDHVSPSALTAPIDNFAPTPLTVPGALTIKTSVLAARLLDRAPLLMIDLGTGTHVIAGALWADTADKAEGDDVFVSRLVSSFEEHAPRAPIVIFSDGPYGLASYSAALHLAARGVQHVYWYRGGEEAWAASGFPGIYRRPD